MKGARRPVGLAELCSGSFVLENSREKDRSLRLRKGKCPSPIVWRDRAGPSARERKQKRVQILGLAIRQLLIQLAHLADVHLLRFADLVVMAGRLHPFPFRTRP